MIPERSANGTGWPVGGFGSAPPPTDNLGANNQGATLEEARENLREPVELDKEANREPFDLPG